MTHIGLIIGRICQMVYLRRSVHLIRKWHIPYHFIAWGLPLCAVIAGFAGTVRLPAPACSLTPARAELNLGLGLGLQAYGAVPGIPWCFLRDSEWWTWGLFYFPGTLCFRLLPLTHR